MYNKELVLEHLHNIEKTLDLIIEWTADVHSVDDFAKSPNGMLLLDSMTIKLMAIGEEIKNIDRRTRGELLARYPQVDWKGATGIRDVIAHGYFNIDADIVLATVKNKVPSLLTTIRQIIKDVQKD